MILSDSFISADSCCLFSLLKLISIEDVHDSPVRICQLWMSSSPITCFAVGPRPALHAAWVPKLVAHVVAEVVVTGTAHFVALPAVVVFVAAHADGVLQPGDGVLVLHRLSLLPGIDHPFVDAAPDQQLLIWTKSKQRHESSEVSDWMIKSLIRQLTDSFSSIARDQTKVACKDYFQLFAD